MKRKFKESKNIKDDPYLSAMRLRYGYALTCYKAQGGEWDKVIIHPFRREADARWLYTAVTFLSEIVRLFLLFPTRTF